MTIAGLIIGALLALAMYYFGWTRGRHYGRDEGWVDAVLAQARRDAARRDRLGRFKREGAS